MKPLIIFLIIIILFIMTISIMTIVLIKNKNDRIKSEVKEEEDRKIATQLYSENKMWVEFYGDHWGFTGPFTKLYTEECSKYTHGFCAEETYEIRILPPGLYPYQIKGDDLYKQFDIYSSVFMTPDFMSESGEHYFIQSIDNATGKIIANGISIEKINENEILITGLLALPVIAKRKPITLQL